MRQEMKNPHRVGIAGRERQPLCAHGKAGILVSNTVSPPTILTLRTVVEWWIGENVVGFNRRVPIVEVRVAELDVSVEPMDKEVHPAKTVSEFLLVLPYERQAPSLLGED